MPWLFLDRGELERLIDAEAAYEGQADLGGRPEPYDDDDPRYAGRPDDDRYGRRRRRGFLGDLFDSTDRPSNPSMTARTPPARVLFSSC